MGWISEALKVIFGMDDEACAYRDSLAAAERYLEWGTRQRRPGDLQEVLKLLEDCPDEQAPNVHYRYRKERTAAETYIHLARLALEGLRAESEKLDSDHVKMRDGRVHLINQIEVSRRRVDDLEADGSLISAREERRRMEDMEREVHDLPDLDQDRQLRRAAAYALSAPRIEDHRQQAGGHLGALRGLAGLTGEDAAFRDKICARFDELLAGVDSDWKTLSASFRDALEVVKQAAAEEEAEEES